jgi:hypothetical protein
MCIEKWVADCFLSFVVNSENLSYLCPRDACHSEFLDDMLCDTHCFCFREINVVQIICLCCFV